MSAVFKREFKNFFTGPMGYVFLALFAFFQGMMFASMYSAGYPYIEYLFDYTVERIKDLPSRVGKHLGKFALWLFE